MKILFYINQIYEGGAERVITQLASSFADLGHESILVTSFEHSGEYSFSENVRRLSLEGEELETGPGSKGTFHEYISSGK